MFNWNEKRKSELDDPIKSLIDELNSYEPSDKEYSAALEKLTTLYELREKQKPERVSRDTLAVVLGNLIGIIVIVGHERAHVVTSKALDFVKKSR